MALAQQARHRHGRLPMLAYVCSHSERAAAGRALFTAVGRHRLPPRQLTELNHCHACHCCRPRAGGLPGVRPGGARGDGGARGGRRPLAQRRPVAHGGTDHRARLRRAGPHQRAGGGSARRAGQLDPLLCRPARADAGVGAAGGRAAASDHCGWLHGGAPLACGRTHEMGAEGSTEPMGSREQREQGNGLGSWGCKVGWDGAWRCVLARRRRFLTPAALVRPSAPNA